jgi:hypothetical protein
MEGLPTSILPREARFAYLTSALRLAEIYVPFVRHTSERVAIPPTCCGHIDRDVRRQLRCRDTCGLLPKRFTIWRRVFEPHRLAIPERMRGVAIVPISYTSVTLGPSTGMVGGRVGASRYGRAGSRPRGHTGRYNRRRWLPVRCLRLPNSVAHGNFSGRETRGDGLCRVVGCGDALAGANRGRPGTHGEVAGVGRGGWGKEPTGAPPRPATVHPNPARTAPRDSPLPAPREVGHPGRPDPERGTGQGERPPGARAPHGRDDRAPSSPR